MVRIRTMFDQYSCGECAKDAITLGHQFIDRLTASK
jgi:hypothetical protein